MTEMWVPRCPGCGESNLLLAPANQNTKHAIAFVEIFCSHCNWRGRLDENIKKIYARL